MPRMLTRVTAAKECGPAPLEMACERDARIPQACRLRILPLKPIQLCVSVGIIHAQVRTSLHLKLHSITHFGFSVFEAVRQDDLRAMLFAGDRVLDGFNRRSSNAGDFDGARSSLTIACEANRRVDRI